MKQDREPVTRAETVVPIEELLEHADWLRRLAVRLLRGHDPEDAVQDTWLAALHTPPAAGRPTEPWLAEVLRNFVRKRWRDGRVRDRAFCTLGADGELVAPSPHDLLERAQVQRNLVEAVVALEEPYRTAILLRYYEGRSAADIARGGGLPAGTVRWRLSEGIRRLRARLDEAHQGDPNRWQRALLPLAGPPLVQTAGAGSLTFARLAGLLGISTAAIALGWMAVTSFGAPTDPELPPRSTMSMGEASEGESTWQYGLPDRAQVTKRLDEAVDGMPRPIFLAQEVPRARNSPSTCQQIVSRLRKRLDEIHIEFRRRGRVDTLYALGEPNPKARELLLPVIERVLRAEGVPPPTFTLDCRTWACRLSVIGADDRKTLWSHHLQRDTVTGFPRSRLQFTGAPPKLDPARGLVNEQEVVFLSLEGHDGAPLLPGVLAPLPAPAAPAEALALCRKERTAIETKIAALRLSMESLEDPSRVFGRYDPNPILARELEAELRAILGDETVLPDLTVECRGQYCKMAARESAARMEMWRSPLRRSPAFVKRIRRESAFVTESYLHVIPKDWTSGKTVLEDRLASLEASLALEKCAARFPKAVGTLIADFKAPWPGELNANGKVWRLSLNLGGSLHGTALGRCVQAAIERHVLADPLPKRTTGTSLRRTFEFPRSMDGR
jgi:RNA polymerase sigma factor (sigma-70 family)